MSVTAVFTQYRRPENLRQIIDQIKTQTLRPKIFIWNNSAGSPCPEADWRIDSSVNAITWPRWFMASMAKTEYVCLMDDDLMFTDERVLRDAVDFLKGRNERLMIGPYGVSFPDVLKIYKESSHVSALAGRDQRVDMIKGRLVVLRTDALKNVNLVPGGERQFFLSDDILVSSRMARGKRGFHCVPSLFAGRVQDLPMPHASCDSADHYLLREKARREYFSHTALETGIGVLKKIKRKIKKT